ncbi:MAG: hypothetical protein M5U07_24585 [Xanthobacteraceae bacterium]|nr:hypothetical protein [Xanthobacteraceae bacterium]
MSAVEDLVLGELAKDAELEALERGFRGQRGPHETRLWFEATDRRSDDEPVATAFVETLFDGSWPAPDDPDLARVNRRAVFGSFFSENGRFGLRASCCIYEDEPEWQSVAVLLLRTMDEQASMGHGIAQCEFAPDALPVQRADLGYPRTWTAAQPPDAFERTAARFREHGLLSLPGDDSLILELPLDDGAPSRTIDPTAETALVHVTVGIPHPVAGVGYLATMVLPFDPPRHAIPGWCRRLNAEEHRMHHFAPRLGAWGMRGPGTELAYSLFWPTAHGIGGFVSGITNWSVRRALWIRERFWQSGRGLCAERSDA